MLATVSTLKAPTNARRSGAANAARSASAVTPASDADVMLHAVRARLARLASSAPTHETRTGVLECVEALQQLPPASTLQTGREHALEAELLAARTALARARVEIVAIRADAQRSRRLALHDALTTLPNRSFFGEWLGRALVAQDGEPQPLAVFYLDLDGFKCINDTHGHGVGDELLRIVASRLARAVRAEDVVSRLGGDEFACALTNLAGRDQLRHVARKLFDSVSAPVQIGPLELAVRPSIGIAMCPADGDAAESLMRNADLAMYHAKRRGSGFAFFDETGAGSTAIELRAAAV